MEGTQDTHTRRPEVAVNVISAFNPSQTVLPLGPPRSSGQLFSAQGPSELSVLVRDGQESVLARQGRWEYSYTVSVYITYNIKHM